MQPYNFTTRYRPGRENGNADGLSRQAWDGDQDEERKRQQPFQGGGDVRPQPWLAAEQPSKNRTSMYMWLCMCNGCKNIIFFIL